jgi:hypothetical protein
MYAESRKSRQGGPLSATWVKINGVLWQVQTAARLVVAGTDYNYLCDHVDRRLTVQVDADPSVIAARAVMAADEARQGMAQFSRRSLARSTPRHRAIPALQRFP